MSIVWLAVMLLVLGGRPAAADDPPTVTEIELKDGRELAGRIVVDAGEAGLLVETPDGAWIGLPRADIARQAATAAPYRRATVEELKTGLAGRLGDGFVSAADETFVVFTDGPVEVAEYAVKRLAKLKETFAAEFPQPDGKPREIAGPLAVVVFARRAAFLDQARRDNNPGAENSRGYYSGNSNRIAFFDQKAAAERSRSASKALRLFQTEDNLSTLFHEATHQLAFNSGLQVRLAANPLWITEGLAMQFETFRGSRWLGPAATNGDRRSDFRASRLARTPGWLRRLVRDELTPTDAASAREIYAAAYAAFRHLRQKHPAEFAKLLAAVGTLPPLVEATGDDYERVFAAVFETPLDDLEEAIVREYKVRR